MNWIRTCDGRLVNLAHVTEIWVATGADDESTVKAEAATTLSLYRGTAKNCETYRAWLASRLSAGHYNPDGKESTQ